jgi:Ca2+-binding RTX toxin-like protein
VIVSAVLTGALTVSSLASGGTVEYTAAIGQTTAVGVTSAAASKTDVVNLSIKGAAPVNVNTITVADVETINFLTDDTATTPTGIAHVANLAATAAKTITVAGDAGLTLTNTDTTITSFDASGVTKGAVTWTTGVLAAASTIKGGADGNTIDASAAVEAVTLTGGAKVDILTGSTTKANTIDGGDGNDVLTGGNVVDTITGGAGNDTIASGTGLDIVTGGAGKDTFTIAVEANGSTYTTIRDASAGDIIDIAGLTGAFATAKVVLGGTAVFQDYLDAVVAANAGPDHAGWFEFGGDTYIAADLGASSTTFTNAEDAVVKLTGLVDLSKATAAGGDITIV